MNNFETIIWLLKEISKQLEEKELDLFTFTEIKNNKYVPLEQKDINCIKNTLIETINKSIYKFSKLKTEVNNVYFNEYLIEYKKILVNKHKVLENKNKLTYKELLSYYKLIDFISIYKIIRK